MPPGLAVGRVSSAGTNPAIQTRTFGYRPQVKFSQAGPTSRLRTRLRRWSATEPRNRFSLIGQPIPRQTRLGHPQKAAIQRQVPFGGRAD